LSPTIVDAIKTGVRPTGMAPDLDAAYNLVDELLTTHQVSDARYQAAKEKFGEKGIVDMLATIGWYTFVSMNLNVDRYPLANGASGELRPLENPLPLANPSGFATPSEKGKRFAAAGTGPAEFDITSRSPDMSATLRALGEQVKKSPVDAKLKELTILIAARYWTSQVEWQEHSAAAITAGLKESTVKAVAQGKLPTKLPADEQAVYNFCTQLFKNKQISDATFNDLKDKVGERGIVEIVGAAGYTQVISMFLNLDRTPLPSGAKAELPSLARPLP
jgi:4-carboxymuconolactone decarboxylase